LYWLGHAATMSDDHLPKQLLFGQLPQRQPPHGAKLCWCDKIRWNLKAFYIDEVSWYVLAQDRQEWCKVCDRSSSDSTNSDNRLYCDGYRHGFSWPQDKARHNCTVLGRSMQCECLRVLLSVWTSVLKTPRHKCSRSERVWWLTQSAIRQKDITFWWSSIQVQDLCVHVFVCIV